VRSTFIALCFLLIFPLISHAHRITIFARAEGKTIYGETSFSGNRKPVNVDISVFKSNDKTTPVLITKTDSQGKFSFVVPAGIVKEHPDLLLVVNTGEGHRAEWPMQAAEYLGTADKQTLHKKPAPANPGVMNILSGLASIFFIAGAIALLQARKKKKRGSSGLC